MHLRRHKRIVILAGVAVLAAAWLWPRLPRSAARALDSADGYELFSIDPERDDAHAPDDFHGHKVLGRVMVPDQATRRRLDHALRDGVRAIFTSRNECFEPRLGIRLAGHGPTVDLLICFGCKRALVWQADQVVDDWTTDRSPEPAFDQALLAAGVPLPPDE